MTTTEINAKYIASVIFIHYFQTKKKYNQLKGKQAFDASYFYMFDIYEHLFTILYDFN